MFKRILIQKAKNLRRRVQVTEQKKRMSAFMSRCAGVSCRAVTRHSSLPSMQNESALGKRMKGNVRAQLATNKRREQLCTSNGNKSLQEYTKIWQELSDKFNNLLSVLSYLRVFLKIFNAGKNYASTQKDKRSKKV